MAAFRIKYLVCERTEMIDKTVARLTAVLLTVGAMAAHGEVSVFSHGDPGPAGLARSGDEVESSRECNNCTFGVDGGNDLGNGIKAIYRMDWGYDGDKTASRDQWLGLSGNFGEVKLGSLSSRYKSEGVIPDPVYRASSLNDTGIPSVQAGHKVDAVDSVDEDGGIGLSYENAGLLVFADYISGNTAQNDTAYNVGARYTAENFAVFGQYRLDTGTANDQFTNNPGVNTDAWFLGGSLTLGATSLYAGYGKSDDGVNASALSGYNAWELVGVRSVGRLTSIYAGYSGTGCIDKNPGVCNKNGTEAVGDDKFSLGIRHKF
jgi:predicted porin